MSDKIIGMDLGPEQVMDAIERIVGDEFCHDAECRLAFHPEEIPENERVAIRKLLDVYAVVHAYNRRHSCYHVHDDWRRNALLFL